jgi:multicomponent K+:H+ antiporter subunit D
VERSRSANEAPLDEEEDAMPSPLESLHPPKGINLDDEQQVVIGQIIPWTMAFLGLSFIACALLIIGMPPLSGFIGKLNLISALFNPQGMGITPEQPLGAAGWTLVTLLVLSGMASLIAFGRVGIQRFWKPEERPSPVLRRYECVPIVILLGLCIFLSLKAEPLLRYTQDTAASLRTPEAYIKAVMSTRPLPGPTTAGLEVQP